MQVFLNQTIAALARRFCRDRVSALEQRISEAAGSPARLPEVRQLMTEKKEWLQHLAKGPFPEVFPPEPLD